MELRSRLDVLNATLRMLEILYPTVTLVISTRTGRQMLTLSRNELGLSVIARTPDFHRTAVQEGRSKGALSQSSHFVSEQ